MRVLLLTIALAGCTTIPQGWLDADDPSAHIVIAGNQLQALTASATLTGPIQEDATYTIAGAEIDDLEWNVLDTPLLTVGDQFWYDGAGPVWAVDTRKLAPANLIAMCGNEVYFTFTFGTTMADGHQESTGTTVDTSIECY